MNSVENVTPYTSATAGVSASSAATAGPVAELNSVQQVECTFNPERFLEASSYSGSFWSVTSSIPIQTQRLWGRSNMEEMSVKSASVARPPLGHYIFDNECEVWLKRAPPSHAAKKVWIEFNRASYTSSGRTREMKLAIFGLAFSDSGAQVTLINPSMVKAMGGVSLVTNASLLIKDAGEHLMNTQGAVFIVVSLKDKVTGLMRRSHQMAYVSLQAEDVVLSREAMET